MNSHPGASVVLIGFMGSGKSTVGKRLAKRWNCPFHDTDQLVTEKAGKSIPEIFAEMGEERFRDMEAAALASLNPAGRSVVATGGGVVLREENRKMLAGLGFVVWLTADEGVLYERVSRNSSRPLLQTENPEETVKQLYRERIPLYESTAHCIIDSSHMSHKAAVEMIQTRAEQYFAK